MQLSFNTIALTFLASLTASPVLAQSLNTVDSLNIDAEITVRGDYFARQNADANLATITLTMLDAAALEINQDVTVVGNSEVRGDAEFSEASIDLSGDMGTVSIDQTYRRSGRVFVEGNAQVNLATITVAE